MKTILVPIDLSEVSRAVVDAAVSLARDIGAQIVLLHVIRPSLAIDEFPDYLQELARSSEQALNAYRDGIRAQGVEARTCETFGQPQLLILEEAQRLSPDYIVMGSHRHTVFYELVLGSTTTAVLREASCPVLVVSAPKRQPVRSRTEVTAEAVHA